MGHYGSGKSEFSINFAKTLIKQGLKVSIADLDIVNPYFRSREEALKLNNIGIDVVADTLNSTKGLDMPYLSPAIKGHIINKSKNVILDCGGDNVGTRVLKQFYQEIIARDHEVYMVVNTYRPETSKVDDIIKMQESLEAESGLKVTGYINNSNFLRQTTIDDIMYADALLKEVNQITGIPIVYVSGSESIINKLSSKVSGKPLTLDMSLRSEWL